MDQACPFKHCSVTRHHCVIKITRSATIKKMLSFFWFCYNNGGVTSANSIIISIVSEGKCIYMITCSLMSWHHKRNWEMLKLMSPKYETLEVVNKQACNDFFFLFKQTHQLTELITVRRIMFFKHKKSGFWEYFGITKPKNTVVLNIFSNKIIFFY